MTTHNFRLTDDVKLDGAAVNLWPEFSLDTMSGVRLTLGIHSIINSTYRQNVYIELIQNLHVYGKIMLSFYGDEKHQKRKDL